MKNHCCWDASLALHAHTLRVQHLLKALRRPVAGGVVPGLSDWLTAQQVVQAAA